MKLRPAPSTSSTSKRYLALARVSSREQEREGFSLDVQVDALTRYAEREGGTIVKLFRVAETASKTTERKVFKEMLAYARANADKIDGLLVYKIDRAARNLFDYVELERLESVHGVPLIAVSQPTENTPAGRMQRRVLASMASFTTEQQAIDVKEGLARRAQSGLFVGMTPYGYLNVRVNGRSIVQVDKPAAANVRLIFQLYAHERCTLDMICQRLADRDIAYLPEKPAWTRSKVHNILHDRSYIGDLRYQGQWHPGSHVPIVDTTTFAKVQALMGEHEYKTNDLLYAGGLIRCAHCGGQVTGEKVIKKATGKEYVYYRCTMYNRPGHPRVRLREQQIDDQVLALFAKMKQQDSVTDWFTRRIREWSSQQQQTSRENIGRIEREMTLLREQQARLLNLRLLDEIDADTFGAKNTELRDRIAAFSTQLEATDRSREEQADLALRTFELSQSMAEKWLTADFSEKRKMVEIVVLNFSLDGVSLVPTINKPFDMLVEGLLVPSSRGDKI
jgi:site-specific DNA recombinase